MSALQPIALPGPRRAALRGLICLALASMVILAGLVFAGSAAALGTEEITTTPTEQAVTGSTTETVAQAGTTETPATTEVAAGLQTPAAETPPVTEEGSVSQTPPPETPAPETQQVAPPVETPQAPPVEVQAEAPAPPPVETPQAPAPPVETPAVGVEEGQTKVTPIEEHQAPSKGEETQVLATKTEESTKPAGLTPAPVFASGSTPPPLQIAIGPLSTPSEPPPLLMIAASGPSTAEAIAKHTVAQREHEAACELSLGPASGSCTAGWLGNSGLVSATLVSAAGAAPVYAAVSVVLVPWTTTVVGLPHTGSGIDGAGDEPAGSHPAGGGPSQAPPPSGASGGAPAGGSSAAPSVFLTLAGLLLLAAPRAMRRMRLRCKPWLTAFFVLIPERPG